ECEDLLFKSWFVFTLTSVYCLELQTSRDGSERFQRQFNSGDISAADCDTSWRGCSSVAFRGVAIGDQFVLAVGHAVDCKSIGIRPASSARSDECLVEFNPGPSIGERHRCKSAELASSRGCASNCPA